MKTNVTFCDFCDGFRDHNRNENFSYDGKKALYDWLEGLEDDQGEEIELDVIALCCEFTEYRDIVEFQANYSHAGDYETIEDIENDTTIIKINDDSFIIQDF